MQKLHVRQTHQCAHTKDGGDAIRGRSVSCRSVGTKKPHTPEEPSNTELAERRSVGKSPTCALPWLRTLYHLL